MIFLLGLELAAALLLILKARGKYAEELTAACVKKDKLACLIPAALEAMTIFRHSCRSRYEARLEIKLRELEGVADAHNLLRIHMARKIVTLYFFVMFFTFVCMETDADYSFIATEAAIMLALYVLPDRNLDKRLLCRHRSIQIDFPEFLNKLVLLVNAGQTVSAAVQKIVRDSSIKSPLYKELAVTLNEISAGIPELQAFENFAKRCRTHDASMFAATLIQNLRKGNASLIPVLRLQAAAGWDNRRNLAKKLGEEASTKLIFPMMLIFIAIVAMVIAPAVFQMNF